MFLVQLFLLFSIAPTTTQDLLPPEGFLGKWHKSGVVRVFHGADLYGHINGGSELFLEFGFEELVVQNYESGADELSLELYRMTDPLAARGIYLMKAGKQSSGQLPFPHTLGEFQLLFARGTYLIIVNNHEGHAEKVPEMVEAARHISGRLPSEDGARWSEALASEGQLPGSIRLIRGPYALESVYTLGTGNILSLSAGQPAYSADYDRNGKTWTLIACDYPAPATARKAYDYLIAHLDPYLKVIPKAESGLVFEDYASEYGTIAICGSRLEITVHLKQKP